LSPHANVATTGGRGMSDVTPTVYVVDDDPSVRRATERLVRSLGFHVETFASAREFTTHARVTGPACLVLDVNLPGASGFDLQKELREADIDLPIIFISGRGTIPMSVRAMKGGAIDFLTKPTRTRDLIGAIETAIARHQRSQRARRDADDLRERYTRLTTREREVLALVVAGRLNKQIAAELATSERTVKFHRAHLMRKMGADSVADLVRMATQLGVAPVDRRT
jgi:FixJ family two-component response regulator